MRCVLLALLVCVASPVFAQEKERLAATDISVRTILSFKASDAAVQKMLPAGWEVSSPTTGSGKGFNLSIFLIDFQMVQDSAGKPLPALPTVVLVIPAKKIGLDATANVVFSGFAAQAGTPGPYGVNSLAKVTVDRRSHADTDGKAIIEESWEAKAGDGSALEIQIQFARGVPDRDKAEGKFYSAAKPEFYRTYRYEQSTDVARSTAAGVDRVTKFSFKASGPKLAPLFDGSEQLISVTSIPWYSRSIYLPVL
jgi:hypothetical protein